MFLEVSVPCMHPKGSEWLRLIEAGASCFSRRSIGHDDTKRTCYTVPKALGLGDSVRAICLSILFHMSRLAIESFLVGYWLRHSGCGGLYDRYRTSLFGFSNPSFQNAEHRSRYKSPVIIRHTMHVSFYFVNLRKFILSVINNSNGAFWIIDSIRLTAALCSLEFRKSVFPFTEFTKAISECKLYDQLFICKSKGVWFLKIWTICCVPCRRGRKYCSFDFIGKQEIIDHMAADKSFRKHNASCLLQGKRSI